MTLSKTSIFEYFPSPFRTLGQQNATNSTALTLEAFRHTDIRYRIRTQTGKKEIWKYFTINQLAEKWSCKKAIINVTSLHFCDTLIENLIYSKCMSQLNLYPCATAHTAWLEMMTLVVSDSAAVSDPHSDDSNGSNHCFTSKQLWLVWDINEGMVNGLEYLG